MSEDIVVPVERLPAAVVEIAAIGEKHGLQAVNWGYPGDGNIHATFLIALNDADELKRAREGCARTFFPCPRSRRQCLGEHGIGVAKVAQLEQQWERAAIAAARAVNNELDPKAC